MSSAMTSAPEQQPNSAAQSTHAEPPAKRRRGGRRTSNPDISTEERKRLRVLKNRESAMRSLAKKAQHSAMLETTEKEAISEYKSSRAKLECLVAAAIGLRTELSKVPGDVNQLIIQVDASINRGTVALATDDDGPADDSPLPAEVSALQNSTNDCAADEK